MLQGQSPQNGTVRQCVTSKFDITKCSKFIKIGFTTFKEYGIPFKKTYGATSQTSMLRLASNSNFLGCHTLTFCKTFVFDNYMSIFLAISWYLSQLFLFIKYIPLFLSYNGILCHTLTHLICHTLTFSKLCDLKFKKGS